MIELSTAQYIVALTSTGEYMKFLPSPDLTKKTIKYVKDNSKPCTTKYLLVILYYNTSISPLDSA